MGEVVEYSVESQLAHLSRCNGKLSQRLALYSASNSEFYRQLRDLPLLEDLSFSLSLDGNRSIVLLANAYQLPDGGVDISLDGLPCLCGATETNWSDIPESSLRRFRSDLKERLSSFDRPIRAQFRDFLDNGSLAPASDTLMTLGGQPTFRYSRTLDLSQSEASLWNRLRKTIRWNVNWGLKNLELEVLGPDEFTQEHLEMFRELHINAAGRETRQRASWLLQLEQVRCGEAFVVFGSIESQLVTAALFSHWHRHVYYGVSASDRSLFNKPISHAVIWKAILHCKNELGCEHFELGDVFGADQITAKKEKDIGFFKRSFGGETDLYMDVVLESDGNTVS